MPENSATLPVVTNELTVFQARSVQTFAQLTSHSYSVATPELQLKRFKAMVSQNSKRKICLTKCL